MDQPCWVRWETGLEVRSSGIGGTGIESAGISQDWSWLRNGSCLCGDGDGRVLLGTIRPLWDCDPTMLVWLRTTS